MLRRPSLPPFPAGALLVGGAVRDWLRGLAPRDFDWAASSPAQAAQALAAQVGGPAFALDEARGYWRVQTPAGIQHDFVPLPQDITSDLLRRDFTVNALALTADRKLLDPAGGRADLRARRLRMVSEANLREDPLRAWRAVRFETTLGFRLEPATETAVRQAAADLAAGRLPLPAPERVRDEWQVLLSHPNAARGVQRMERLGLLALTLPELREGIGVQQGGFHHLDVFGHGLEALHQLLSRFPEAELPLRWATLLHDVGKPRTRETEKHPGRITFYGHERVGAELAREALTRLRLPSAEVNRVAALIRAHMAHLPSDEREARRFVHRRRELLPDLLRLMLADREAARGPQSTPGTRQAYALGIERVLAALEEQPAPPPPLLSGHDVMALLHLPPGPAVGAALRAVAEAQALGEVRTAQEARSFLQAWHTRNP
ncbi:HD domain-containing protein [Deinococcus sp. YIM 77859]|uniref:HD domain-containing protein n=1 Tax=Deinococcus sp. YIM 77859 TaxID=1540221 RepID=UPI0005500D59|nr:HD domain-containing protein [Deinococcus sp. YIM 77859]